MNKETMEGKWKQWKGAAKEKWGKLTDDDLDVIAGRRDQLIGKIEERYGVAKDDARKQTDAWMKAMEEQNTAARHEHEVLSGKR